MPEAVARPGTVPLARRRLLDSLGPLLREWLPRQRWFAGKGRPITGFELVSATDLLPPGSPQGLIHLLVRVKQPPASAEPPAPRSSDCYQLLIGVHQALPRHLAPALIGHARTGPLSGQTLYEALHDPRLADVLLEALRSRARIGSLCFEHDSETELPAKLPPRVLGAEQSNSSLIYGESYILKLLRRVVEGVNPDLELPLVLARDGCRQVPAPAAWFLADGSAGRGHATETSVLGVMTPFLSGAEGAWELALDALAARRPFTEEAHGLGRATGAVHASLGRALPTVTLGRAQLAVLARAMTDRLDGAAEVVPALREFAPRLRTAFTELGALDPAELAWSAQRVHGDLHLGQCLRQRSGEWSVIDFEGEPARPLAERRLPQPPVRDVAGMLRSFDYAARTLPRTAAQEHAAGPGGSVSDMGSGSAGEDPAAAGPDSSWYAEWAEDCRAAYCAGYAEVAGRDPRADPVLLRAYETDKAVYEVVYESRNRPDWVSVPMAAVRRLAAAAGPR
ncbi:maltokinase N-terminal cap-like domain-containing protein [Streptomyces physcomitrii]|uniref:Maltokinase n=1 Tax=Streptomyces physcomitrii TaxID=2724184 RepID=A0ABX1HB85_9ACTN|nr:maltokinase [Streptomyces physcomitrii]NKI45322.1 maltokinase [Streptomyces physcomitrii]